MADTHRRESGKPEPDEHRRAGFLVTHTARVSRVDGESFAYGDTEPVVEALCWQLSALRGAYISAPLRQGLKAGDQVWTRHVPGAVDTWAGDFGAFPTGFVAAEDASVLPALGRAIETLLTLRREPGMRDGLDRGLLWYRTANTGGTTGDIVLAQAGLELLAFLALVPPGTLTAKGFDRLTAADQIRLLLRQLALPVEVPPDLPGLAAWAAGEHATAAPETVATFRNIMVHPPTRQRRLSADDQHLIVEARTLALSLLEQALLCFVGYDSLIRDRVSGWQMRPLITSATFHEAVDCRALEARRQPRGGRSANVIEAARWRAARLR